MKTITILIATLTLLALNVYSQKKDVKGLLDNEETRTVIFNTIVNDHGMMMDFIKIARENEHSAMMLRNSNNPKIEKLKMKKGRVEMSSKDSTMSMMKENPEMMKKMMGKMMDICEQDFSMCNNMANMMIEHPEMMKMCMQKMKEKGMMGSDGKMKMVDPKSKEEQKKHNHQH